MTKKDLEKDSERPHYYSQFWLDVAAGRRVIGAPKTNDDADIVEPEIHEPVVLRRPVRSSTTAISDGYHETLLTPEVEPIFDTEEFVEPEPEELELEDYISDTDIPNIVVEEKEIPDMDLAPLEEEEEEEEEDFLIDEEEEEEEDLGWNVGRGRKKPKPGRPVKLPPKKPGKREPRRGF